jgi:hypothetical protein
MFQFFLPFVRVKPDLFNNRSTNFQVKKLLKVENLSRTFFLKEGDEVWSKMKIEKDWRVEGTHYEKTSLAWLRKMDSNKREVLELFSNTYGENEANKWFQRWRIFFMSCEVLFGFNKGNEWGVSHYLFKKP